MSIRVSGGLVRIVANVPVPGDGMAVANAQTAYTLSLGKRAIVRHIRWRNRTGVNCSLLVGFGDRTAAGSLFRQVYPRILCLNGMDDGLTEEELGIMGNSPEGFANDTTIPTGTTGNILVATDDAVGIAAGTPLEVEVEVEEI